MATQNHSAAARSKPKVPSKSQMVMEQLKASMEAEKLRAKKEIRSKLVTTPNKGGGFYFNFFFVLNKFGGKTRRVGD